MHPTFPEISLLAEGQAYGPAHTTWGIRMIEFIE